jgi:phage terminase large subunit-like protein
MEPVPEFVFTVGVNTTEYTVEDVVVSVLMVPPLKVMSSAVKLDDASESVKVIVSV